MKTLKISICLLGATLCLGAKLPSTFKKCSRKLVDFSKCLPEAVEDAIRQMDKPMKEVALPSLAPLEIPILTIGAGRNAVGVQQNYKNVKIFGFTKIDCSTFDMNFEKKTVHMKCFLPSLELNAEYKLKGKILLLPIYGTGSAKITLEQMNVFLDFHLDEFEKKAKKHFKVVDSKLLLEPGLVKFNFENLFDGDKALGDNINKVLNDNWSDIFDDIKSNYEEAFGKIAGNIFNNLLTKVPISDIFID